MWNWTKPWLTSLSRCVWFPRIFGKWPRYLHVNGILFLCPYRTNEICFLSTWNPLTEILCTKHSACASVKLLNDFHPSTAKRTTSSKSSAFSSFPPNKLHYLFNYFFPPQFVSTSSFFILSLSFPLSFFFVFFFLHYFPTHLFFFPFFFCLSPFFIFIYFIIFIIYYYYIFFLYF